MRFTQLDRILTLNKGESIEACRCLALSESYLADHFPRFPVMPGVLMLEALYQASMWLVLISEDFEKSYVALRETKSMKFKGFVQPGDTLDVPMQDFVLQRKSDIAAGCRNDKRGISGWWSNGA